MNVVTINKREFMRYPHRGFERLIEADILEVRGRKGVEYSIMKGNVVANVAPNGEGVVTEIADDIVSDEVVVTKSYLTYGCGCEKKDGKVFCVKHGRL